MKKQGFTLIELMVVIVIMGILAAVAVPKLFGMIAKSKASEVGPAAGTYVKLQQAFVAEKNTYGGWTAIGYTAPGKSATNTNGSGYTTNFAYSGSFDKGTTSHTSGTGWTAASRTQLNDCPQGNSWTVTLNAITNDNDSYTASAGTDAACVGLTPNFDKIGR